MLPDPYWSAKYNPGSDQRLFWLLDARCTGREVEGTLWKPGVYHDALHFPIRRWQELAGQVVAWNRPFDDETGQPNGGFYLFEHGNILRGKLQILSRQQ